MFRMLAFRCIVLSVIGGLLGSYVASAAEEANKPNFIIIVLDDLGYGDLGAYGNHFNRTPQMDRLAREGIRFTDFHANSSKCSPTRTSLLTGRYPERSGVNTVFSGISHSAGMVPEAVTFAQPLHEAGYATAVFGKWHVGYALEANPVRHGFDEFRGQLSGGINYFTHIDAGGHHDWWHNEKRSPERGYSTHLITEHALDFISRSKGKPFCLYLPYGAPHIPHMGPDDDDIVRYDQFYGSAETYREMIEEVDKGIGEIITQLETDGLAQNTFVFLTSDNGADKPGSNAPLRGWKAQNFEGGLRVPLIAWHPRSIAANQVTAERAASMDIFPTLLSLAGIPFLFDGKGKRLDGIDLSPLLLKGDSLPSRPLFFAFRDWSTIIDGDWKWIEHDPKWNTPQRGQKLQTFLFNLREDMSEKNNLASDQKEKVAQLKAKWNAWWREMEPELNEALKWARLPVDNFGKLIGNKR